jgi:hypothetical protein
MHRHYAVLLGLMLSLLVPTSAQAFTLGAADGSIEAAPIAKELGAKTYRVVIDPREGLEHYAPRIDAYQRLGMNPQLVIGGTGTDIRGKTDEQGYRIINTALKAWKRWPDTYSISVINEPDLAGTKVCQYSRTFRRAYKALKAAGVPRVLFGELSPTDPWRWTNAVISRCGHEITADGWAWHCYDAHKVWKGIDYARSFTKRLRENRARIHSPRGFTLPLYCTEYGALTRDLSGRGGAVAAAGGENGAKLWARALTIAKQQQLAQIVAWGIQETHADSVWDSSLVRSDGSFRPAFHIIQNR